MFLRKLRPRALGAIWSLQIYLDGDSPWLDWSTLLRGELGLTALKNVSVTCDLWYVPEGGVFSIVDRALGTLEILLKTSPNLQEATFIYQAASLLLYFRETHFGTFFPPRFCICFNRALQEQLFFNHSQAVWISRDSVLDSPEVHTMLQNFWRRFD